MKFRGLLKNMSQGAIGVIAGAAIIYGTCSHIGELGILPGVFTHKTGTSYGICASLITLFDEDATFYGPVISVVSVNMGKINGPYFSLLLETNEGVINGADVSLFNISEKGSVNGFQGNLVGINKKVDGFQANIIGINEEFNGFEASSVGINERGKNIQIGSILKNGRNISSFLNYNLH